MIDDDRRFDDLEAELGQQARLLTGEDRQFDDPPPDLFASIQAELTADDRPATAAQPETTPMAEVISIDHARRRRRLALASAAAIVAVVAIGGALLASGGSDDAEVVASVAIVNDDLPVAHDGGGVASLVDDDGQLVLELDVDALPEVDGFYEVWLIDTNVEGMISLGSADGDGRLSIPAAIDPADFPVVDISVEPVDGDPTHSGQSILRGILQL